MEVKDIKQNKKSFLSRWGIPLFTFDTCLLVFCVQASNSCFVAGTRTIEKHFGFSGTQTQLSSYWLQTILQDWWHCLYLVIWLESSTKLVSWLSCYLV